MIDSKKTQFFSMIALIMLCAVWWSPSLQASETAAIEETYEARITRHIAKYQEYPESAQLYGIEGDAIVRIRIDRSGKIQGYRVIKAAGNYILDEAVVAMVKAANPTPPMPDHYAVGEPVAEFIFPVAFRMKENMDKIVEIDRLFQKVVQDAKLDPAS